MFLLGLGEGLFLLAILAIVLVVYAVMTVGMFITSMLWDFVCWPVDAFYTKHKKRKHLKFTMKSLSNHNVSLTKEEAENINKKGVGELEDILSRVKVAESLNKYHKIRVNWRDHSLETLRRMFMKTDNKSGIKSKVAITKASDVKLCSKGFMIQVKPNVFVLVEGDRNEMKELAKQLFRTNNYLKQEEVGVGQGV